MPRPGLQSEMQRAPHFLEARDESPDEEEDAAGMDIEELDMDIGAGAEEVGEVEDMDEGPAESLPKPPAKPGLRPAFCCCFRCI